MKRIFKFFLFIFFLFSLFIRSDCFECKKVNPSSLYIISVTNQEKISAVTEKEYFIISNFKNKTEINNQTNKNNHIYLSLSSAFINLQNGLNKFIFYKNKFSFGYILYKILNNLKNSIYTRAP